MGISVFEVLIKEYCLFTVSESNNFEKNLISLDWFSFVPWSSTRRLCTLKCRYWPRGNEVGHHSMQSLGNLLDNVMNDLALLLVLPSRRGRDSQPISWLSVTGNSYFFLGSTRISLIICRKFGSSSPSAVSCNELGLPEFDLVVLRVYHVYL